MKFAYYAKRDTSYIAGVITARHSFEALHNARFEAMSRGADGRFIKLDKLS